jgi:hypothetical protein
MHFTHHQAREETAAAQSRLCRLSDRDQTSEALFDLSQDWQRTQTQRSESAFNFW